MMNALTTLANARSSLVTSKTAWFTALVNLAYATGEISPESTLPVSSLINNQEVVRE
jgi:outer membrane protein TolC